MKQAALFLASFLAVSSTGWGGLVVNFDPNDLIVAPSGADQVVDLGILIQHDGVGENTLSGFTLDFSEMSPALEVIQGAGFASDFTWSIGSGVNATSISGSNAGNHTIDMTGTQLLGTLQFNLDGSFTGGLIPISLTFNNAQRNIFDAISPDEFTVTGDTLVVTPEPASLAMMGLAACGAIGLRLRRRKSGRGQTQST